MQPILHFYFLLIIITLLLSITTNPHGHVSTISIHPDEEALLAIKASISDDPHSVLSSWNKSLHFCQWEGVTCGNSHQRVVILHLSNSNLAGTLSPFIGNLSFLHELYLSNNLFRGNIPHQISYLPRLHILMLGTNSFEGEIPANLSSCLHLNTLDLGFNNLVGEIPRRLATLPDMIFFSAVRNNFTGRLKDIGIGNMSTSLQSLFLSFNSLEGSIPEDIGGLKGLAQLGLSLNILSGEIPSSLYNLSNLNVLDLSSNNLHGQLPQDLGLRLPLLSYFFVVECSLSGQFPNSISNLSELVSLEISNNSFVGKFAINGNNLPHLAGLYAQNAFPLGGEGRDLNFLGTLTNCSNLTHLLLGGNSFIGNFPSSVLNLSTSLEYLDLGSNRLIGKVPLGLGKFVNLLALWLHDNFFTGPIPFDIDNMRSIQGLYLSNNNLIGEIPSSLGNLTNLNSLEIGYNYLQGSLPESLGNCTNLLEILANANNFSGSFPTVLFRASSLISLGIGQNNFEGLLPLEISNLKNLDRLDVSQNSFSGEIPNTLGKSTSLTFLDMGQNSFVGSIPMSLSSLKSIKYLNLSSNNLSGQIPNYFSTWPYLSNLNLSFNNLSGEVPTDGIFANSSVVSIAGNDELCGGVPQLHLPRCAKVLKPKKRRLSSTLILIISISCGMIVALSVALCLYFLYSSRKRKDPPLSPQSIRSFPEVSYQMLHMATEGFSLSNLIGIGGFGSVYKGILNRDGTELVVAVKVMNLGNEGASKSFITECKALRNIRHRNLVKVITACSSIDAQRTDFKALVYEFMPKGSLEDWLHSPNRVPITSTEHGRDSLSLLQRLGIIIDVASALEYLLIECANPIIHCDLKPSNILLDDDMIAHVGDFGLAKFVPGALTSNTTNNSSSNQVRGTVGYAAPEYGIGSKVSPEGDMYSLGIIILELMTSKKPTDPMFNNGLNLHDFAKAALPDRVMEIIDHGMLGDDDVFRARNAADIKKRECIKSVVVIGVQCSMESPQERMNIKDVVNKLKSARQNLLNRT